MAGVLSRRVRDVIPGAFAVASVVMVLVLVVRLALRLAIRRRRDGRVAFVNSGSCCRATAVAALAAFARNRGRGGLGAFATTLGASGLFTAIVVCLATAGAIALGRRRLGRRAGDVAGGLALARRRAALFALHFSLAGAIAALVAPLATLGDSFVALFAITAIEAMLWLVGIHGPALLAAIVLPVYLQLQAENTDGVRAPRTDPAHRRRLDVPVRVSGRRRRDAAAGRCCCCAAASRACARSRTRRCCRR